MVTFVLLCNSRFNFHCYTQREAMPTQKSAWKWHCNLSRLLTQKITKGIHLCKPASLNRPIVTEGFGALEMYFWSDYFLCWGYNTQTTEWTTVQFWTHQQFPRMPCIMSSGIGVRYTAHDWLALPLNDVIFLGRCQTTGCGNSGLFGSKNMRLTDSHCFVCFLGQSLSLCFQFCTLL